MHGSTTRRWIARVGSIAVLLPFLFTSSLWANIGPRWWGTLAAEPLGGLKGVAITREKLTIDLRPLAYLEPVSVEAVYQLHNSGAAKKLDLLFVSATSEVSDFEVRLGDQVVESTPMPQDEFLKHRAQLPENWMPPRNLPGIDGENTYPHMREIALQAFSIELPSGPSTLQARYRARAFGVAEAHPKVTWQFPYLLSPSRQWEQFGRLEVLVHLPKGWQSASTPTLNREEDVLRGEFDGLPAEALTVAVRAPLGPELRRAIYLYVALYGLVVVAGGFLCHWGGYGLGWFLVRKTNLTRGQPRLLALCILVPGSFLALVWVGLICGGGVLVKSGITGALAGQESPYFHEHFFAPICGMFVLAFSALLLGVLLSSLSAYRFVWGAHRSAMK
jgi:hypothetical protein